MHNTQPLAPTQGKGKREIKGQDSDASWLSSSIITKKKKKEKQLTIVHHHLNDAQLVPFPVSINVEK